ncbi:MAG TPA: sigma 54-interacting transcriptional regulator [Pyrinomonadaceae bacterium]|nr:sigma 54-interacting transcriptional regulator [Pyrinomonadaceae bacterium]HMP65212.1 sigma 54-interacting transcriptional regulator [Pyrinomonadaceae bacterium]
MSLSNHSEQVLSLLAELNTKLAGSPDPSAVMRPILESFKASLGVDHIFLLIESLNGDGLNLSDAAGLTPTEFRRLDAKVSRSFLSDIYTCGISRSVQGSGDLDYLHGEGRAEKLLLMAFPLSIGKGGVGLLACGVEIEKRDEVVGAFEMLASMITQAMRIQHTIRGERQRLREENLHLKQELKEKYDFSHIVGNSNAIRQVYEQVSQVAKSNATVLLRGESGTGKEMIASAIHYNSLRRRGPFVKINCAALPDTLIESELFGHEKGAFTGADRKKEGRFELAEGGTLFLDEIGDLPLQTQIKLLRVLQEREFERVGGSETIRANIRLITATNKDLEEAISNNQFREDLYYRLNVFTIFLPPLRERKSDILLLAEHFLEKYEAEHRKRIRRISTPAIDMLMSYHFPGNVRELENAIERAVLVCDSNVIHGHHLPATLQTAEVTGTVTDLSLESAVAAFERDIIQDALKSSKGNITRAALSLGSTERIVGYKIRKYGIDVKRFRR